MKKTLIITVLVLGCCGMRLDLFAAGMDKPAAGDIFNKANALYKENKYAAAALEFEKIPQLGPWLGREWNCQLNLLSK